MTGTPSGSGVDRGETVDLLQNLVQIPSPYFEEAEIIDFIAEWLDGAGIRYEFQPVREAEFTGYEGRNIVARLPGSDPTAPVLLVNAHVDTVKLVDGWAEDPLSGRIADGRLYGQGAADTKGGLASMLIALRELAEQDLRGDVLFTAVVDEEGPYGLGTNQLLRDGITDSCDAAIVAEPVPILARGELENPAMALGAPGRFLYEFTVTGSAAHGSTPELGINAINDTATLLSTLSDIQVGSHPELGSGSICTLKIAGGSETISVPDTCRILVDRHVVLGETPQGVLADAQDVIDSLAVESSIDVQFREAPADDVRYGPYITDETHPLVDSLTRGSTVVTGDEPALGYLTSIGDFNYLGHRAGLPTVVLGPAGGNIHSSGEYVVIDDVVLVAELLVAGTTAYLS